jgi:hypothetical protein
LGLTAKIIQNYFLKLSLGFGKRAIGVLMQWELDLDMPQTSRFVIVEGVSLSIK